MADLLARYARLSADENRILRVLSAICEPVGRSALQQILEVLGWRDQGGAPLSRLLSTTLHHRLIADGLIEGQENGLICHPDLCEMATRETVADGTFATIIAAGERCFPMPTPKPGYWPGEARRLRMLRNALYAGHEDAVLEVLGIGADTPLARVPYGQALPLLQVFLRQPDADWIERLGPRLQIVTLVPLLRQAVLGLLPQANNYALMTRLLTPLAASRPDLADALAEQHLVRGRLDAVPPLLRGRTDPEALVLQGWLRFLQGDYADTIAQVEAAELALRKATRKRNVYTPGIPGALYLVALLQRGGKADFERVQQQTAMCLRASVTDPVEHAFRVLCQLAMVLAGQHRLPEAVWLRDSVGGRAAFPTLFRFLALHWLGERPAANTLEVLATCADKATAAGINWYAHEAVALLTDFGFSGAIPDAGEALAGVRLMTELLAVKAPWEIAIDALKGVGSQSAEADRGSAAPATSDRRMLWVIDLHQGYILLEPRDQRRTKNGIWTAGRAVSLQKLADAPEDYPYLTPHDRAICACIVREQAPSWQGGYLRTEYRFDIKRALLAAVGHPCVVRQGRLDTPLELIPARPTLTAVRRSKDVLVSIEPFPKGELSLMLSDDSPQRIRLVQFDAKHREIARIVSEKGISVPRGGEQRLLEGLAAIAPLLTVHSDIGGGAGVAATVPADPRPHLHLHTFDGGLGLECYVHPGGDAGPQFRPGQGATTLFSERDGQPVCYTRDLRGEATAARAVISQCPALDGDDDWRWQLDDLEQALSTLEQLHDLGDAVVLDWPQGKRVELSTEARVSQMRVSIKQQTDWLAIDGGLTLDDGRVLAMRELLDLTATARGRFVRLGEDDYLILSNALRRRLDKLRSVVDDGRFHPLAAPVIDEIIDGMTVETDHAWQALLDQLAAMQSLEPTLPSTLQAELRDYQAEGYRWLARLAHWGAGACLADDMGLGKTVQALALILARAAEGPTLVLAPMSVCGNWIDEAQRFAPTLRPLRFGGSDRAALLEQAGPFDLVVCSYGLLQSEGERLAEVEWQTIVTDEAQAFKNALTKRSQAIMRLRGGFRMITTGTPIENHLGELWNLFRFINPGLLGSLKTFNRRFAAPIEQDRDQGARQRLRQLLRPFILRRLKSEVLSELPARTEITLQLELSAGEMALYEALRQQAIERLDDDADAHPGQQRMQLLAEIMRLRRVCCHPRLALPDSDLPSAKLEAFAEIVDELLDNRHKALVFSQFVDHLQLIRAHLDSRSIRYQYLDGSTPEAQRRAAVAAFQAGDGDLFLISLRAGGAGLNLTAADYVIHMDPWWNPAVEDQASDRAHRIGQQRPVTIYRLVAKGTIEERILRLHAGKRDLADGLLAGTDDGGRLSYADMLALVRGSGGA